jgi:GNAT superfamily N-acetyltransferase
MDGEVRIGDRPGDAGGVIALHGRVYAAEYGLDVRMEGYVAVGLGEWLTEEPKGPGRLWVVDGGGAVVASVGLTARSADVGRLRWFVVDPAWRGNGLGRRLLDCALAFAREAGYRRIVLDTFSELRSAARMYRAAGFERTESWTESLWGREIEREGYELVL